MPVKRCNAFIYSFLSAFLFAATLKADVPHIDNVRTRLKAKQALVFCRKKGYNTKYCILIDMSLPSGVKRFVLWDFAQDHIRISGLVSHGCGTSPWSGVWSKDKPAFSNKAGSHCTPLGKYRIDGRAYSGWGVHVKYFLTGLDTSNSNARIRQMVFHSWEEVPENEVYPTGTPEGWGCPAISNNTMKITDALIRGQSRHLLMWIYD